jgi:hypothetical protein
MHSFIRIAILTLVGLAPITALQAQGTAPAAATSSSKRTDVYHVFFGYAVPGKARRASRVPQDTGPKCLGPSHGIILRHQDGDAWDYVAIEHIGTKATVEIPATPMPASARGLMQKHDDTYVSGPPWAEFAKQMGIDADTAKTTGSAYVVSVYRAAPGQFDALEKMLGEPPNRAVDTSSGQHLDAAPGRWSMEFFGRSALRFVAEIRDQRNQQHRADQQEGGRLVPASRTRLFPQRYAD